MVIMVDMPSLEAVPKLEPSRPLLDRDMVDMVDMVIMELQDRLPKLVHNQLPLDMAMDMAMMVQAAHMPDPNHKTRVNLPSELVVNGQNLARRETGSVFE